MLSDHEYQLLIYENVKYIYENIKFEDLKIIDDHFRSEFLGDPFPRDIILEYVKYICVKLDKNNFDTNFNIGILNFKQRKFHEAEAIFLKLSEHFFDNKDVFYNLGIIKLETNEYDKAKKYFGSSK